MPNIEISSQQSINLELTGQTGGVNSIEITPGGLADSQAVTVEVSNIFTPNFTIDGIATNIEVSQDIVVVGAGTSAAPTIQTAPVVSGTNTVGSTLTSTSGAWNNTPTLYTYQWYRDAVLISGANGTTYIVQNADAGASISCVVRASNTGGYGDSSSNGIVVISIPVNTALPLLTGTPSVGGTLSVSNGSWLHSPNFTYQWLKNGSNIVGASASTYIVQADDQGQQISVRVTGTNAAGSSNVTTPTANIAGVSSSGAPGYVGTGFGVIEAPPTWDWSLTQMEPSRAAVASFTTHEVGPGKTYAEPDEVPWLTLQPGDIVKIYHRPTPYKKIIFIGVRGAWDKWITIEGVKSAQGERPIFDGDGAVLNPNAVTTMGYNTQYLTNTGMIVIAKPQGVGTVSGYKPGYLHITGIEFRNCKEGYTFTNHLGVPTAWSDFVAGIYSVPVEHFAITDCKFENNSLGLFINSLSLEPTQSRWVLVRNNHFKGNGLPGEAHVHNAYTECVGIIYEYNYFDSPVTNTAGDNIKERSAGNIFRYNFIRNGTNLISLRDPQSNGAHEDAQLDTTGTKLSNLSFIYGNTFLVDMGHFYGQQDIVLAHGDGGYGDGAQYRRGDLYFYRNRVICNMDYTPYQAENIPLFAPINTTSPTTFRVYNNLFYGKGKTVGASAPPWSLFYFQGVADFKQNWISSFINASAQTASGGLAVGTQFNGTGLNGLAASASDPLFTALGAGDYSFAVGSPWYDLVEQYPLAITSRGLTPQAEPVNYPFNQLPAPVNSVLPIVSGNVVAGNTLTVSNGSWSGNPSFTYQWYKNGAAISGQTSFNYTTSGADVGTTIVVRVTATNVSGSVYAESIGVTVQSATSPVNVTLPVISGVAITGNTLTVSTGAWTNSPISYAYQWKRAGSNISAATSNTYTLVSSDVNNAITCTVTATSASAETGTATSSGVTAQNPSQDPDINGVYQFEATNGTLLSALNANWKGATGDYEVQGGQLRSTVGGQWTGNPVWYENNQVSDQYCQLKRLGAVFNSGAGVSLVMYVRRTAASNGYACSFSGTGWQLRKDGAYLAGNSMSGTVWESDTVVKMQVIGSVITVYINGSQLFTYNDNTATLVGGYPGFAMYVAGTLSNMQLSAWTDSSSVNL